MFFHIFAARLRCIVRDRQTMFWTLLFPVILGTLFHLTLANVNKGNDFARSAVAVVDDAAYRGDAGFRTALASVSGNAKNALFAVTLCDNAKAESLLKEGKVIGVVRLEDGAPRMTVKETGLGQSILKAFLDDYVQTDAAVRQAAAANPAVLQNLNSLLQTRGYIRAVAPNRAKPDDTLNYFYALLGMACLYGGFLGLKEVSAVQANQSPQAARVALAPVHKLRVFAASLCVATTVQFAVVLVLTGFLAFALGVDFGGRLPLVLLCCLVSCSTGVAFGAAVGALLKAREGLKTAVLITVSMFCSFLSGLFFGDMKYLVQARAPLAALLNPASVITDAFYSLYYYDTTTRFFRNIALLCGFTLVFYCIVYLILRRQRYESI